MNDDTQMQSPTSSDNDRPSPTSSDTVRPRPTLSATRSEAHTLTTTEVAKIFEAAGLPRDKRSIERYCEQGKLDCFKDPDEMRYYITRESVDRLIGHIIELKARHEQPSMPATPSASPTSEPDVRQPATAQQTVDGVKRNIDEKRVSDSEREAYEKKVKELENQLFLSEVGKQAAEQVVTMMRQQITDDRHHYTKIVEQTNEKLTKYSRWLGQLETQVKQLKAPDSDTTADDTRVVDDAEAIDAEFNEAATLADDELPNVSTNVQPL